MTYNMQEFSFILDMMELYSRLGETEELTVGVSDDYSWGYQTGDNSFNGGAYGHPYWAVTCIERDPISVDSAWKFAVNVLEQVQELMP